MHRNASMEGIIIGEKHHQKQAWTVQECSMCGDVGISNQLQHCSRCRSRFQHTYCCNSREGIGSPSWICDWCRLATTYKSGRAEPDQMMQSPDASRSCSVSAAERGALDYLLKAALADAEMETVAPSLSSGGGSFCSSSMENTRGDAASHPSPREDTEDNIRQVKVSQRLEKKPVLSCVPPTTVNCDIKKHSPKLLRFPLKSSSKFRHRPHLEQQCATVQLKRLSSMKSAKNGISCEAPKSFVRRYKSLSDISF